MLKIYRKGDFVCVELSASKIQYFADEELRVQQNGTRVELIDRLTKAIIFSGEYTAVGNEQGAVWANNLADTMLAVANLVNFKPAVTNILQEVAFQGTYMGKPAYNYHIIGRRGTFTSATALNDVGGISVANFVELTGTEGLHIVSTSANDNLSGTGIQKVRLTYIDTSNNIATAEVNLNGLANVSAPLMKEILFMEASQVGTNTVAVGEIRLVFTSNGTIVESITAGGNKSTSARFMVPVGYTAYVHSWDGNAISQSQDIRLRANVSTKDRLVQNAFLFQDSMFFASGDSGSTELPYLKFPELSRIKISTFTGATNGSPRCDCSFSLLLIKN